MAAAIHHCRHVTDSAAFAQATRHHVKPLTPSQVTAFLSPANPSPLASSKTLFNTYPSASLFKTPPFRHLLRQEPLENSQPLTNSEISCLIKLSIEYDDVQLSKAFHATIIKNQEDIRLCNSLITAYVRLGHLVYAEKVFSAILSPDVVSYTAIISGLAKSRRENEAVGLFFEMRGLGIEPNGYTLVALLTACMRLMDLELGSQVHAFSIKTGQLDCTYVANALMALYSACTCLDFVVKLFAGIPNSDIASWNTVISCMVKDGLYERAFEMFADMLTIGHCSGDHFTLSSLLVAGARCSAVKQGLAIHAYAHKIGYESSLSVRNALIEFYAECGCVKDVETLFDSMPVQDVFSWTEMIKAYMGFGLLDLALGVFNRMPEKNFISYNTILTGFCQNGEGLRALEFFCRMLEEGVELNDSTLTSVLRACGWTGDLRSSEQIQAFVLKINFGNNDNIQATLLDMCTRCGRMDDAEKIFHKLLVEQSSSLVTLTTMICGYARNSELDKAISLISHWQCQEYNFMDEVASASVLGVCGDLGFQNLGEQIHSHALKTGIAYETLVGNALISMYSKCGDLEQATKVFQNLSSHDIVSWNCLLTGHVLKRQGDKALDVWNKMQKRRVHPDTITCVLIIAAYKHTHSNLAQEGRNFLHSMKSNYQIEPNSDHYACLVSVFGYWGLLEEAEEIIKKIPFEPRPSVWRALLHSCSIQKNASLGRMAAKKILNMEPEDPSTYILKSNLYSASGRWHCSELLREQMKSRGLRKFPARSWIIHQNEVHTFFARDKSHPQSKDIYSALDILFLECLKAGYEPDTNFVLHEVEEHQKMNFLMYHSGKLAVTYGILTTRPGKPVKVIKNIRLCGDCHTFFKFVSVVSKREIQIRDASGFHCFANGECSCKDYAIHDL